MGCSVVIVGAGGHGRVIADTVIARGDSVRGFLDDDMSKLGENIYRGARVLGRSHDAASFADCRFIVAIGDALRESLKPQGSAFIPPYILSQAFRRRQRSARAAL